MTEPQPAAMTGATASVSPNSGQADFLEILLVLAREKKRILQITGAITLLATLIVFVTPKMYTATATILPPQQNQSVLSTLIGQVGGGAALDLRDLGLKNPADVFVAMLQSRTVEDALVNRFDLRQSYYVKRYQDARKILEKRSEINLEKEGLISIQVSDRDPKRAADIANAWVDELRVLNQDLALTEAAQRRVFFEQKLVSEREDLSKAELALKLFQEKTGLIQPEAQARALITGVADFRAQVGAKQVELQSLRTYATEDNPDVKRVERELAEMQVQLAKLSQMERGGTDFGEANLQVPTRRVPQATLEYLRVARELRYHETLYDFLGKQLEAARIDESKNAVMVQVVDRAVPPERKSSPQRLLIVAVTAAASFLLSCLGVLIWQAIRRMQQDPGEAARIAQLHQYLRNSA
ncbi:MAG TPA: Wzz/FepE/Etk N-terminal domain-containing protein [Terriglobales bacterium]